MNSLLKNGILIIVFSLIFCGIRAADDSFVAYKADTMPVIDGIGNDSCWAANQWYGLDYVWLPYNDQISKTDFSGRFKISWTNDRLLLLVEIVDDSLYDGHSDPLDNYWNDDCVEVFVDEDHSGGPHNDPSNAFNAWAYHVSIFGDVVDPNTAGSKLYNDHIKSVWTRYDSLYTWELSIKIYDKNYVNDQVSMPVTLTNDKVMGFSLAYCDDDGGGVRENFIGSKYLPQSQSNDSYLNASVFGTLTLIDPNAPQTSSIKPVSDENVLIFPNPGKNEIYFQIPGDLENGGTLSLLDISGKELKNEKLAAGQTNGSIDISDIAAGVYIAVSRLKDKTITQRIIIE